MASQMTKTANDISTKWNRNTKNGVPAYQEGINRVNENPLEKAAQNSQKWVNNVSQAQQAYEKGCRSVSLASWKDKALNKGAGRISQGVDAAMAKRQKFDAWLVPTINAGMAKIDAMPNMTFQDSVNRAVAFMTHMNDNKYKNS